MTTAGRSGETDEQHNRIPGNEGDAAEAQAFGEKVKPAEKPSRAKSEDCPTQLRAAQRSSAGIPGARLAGRADRRQSDARAAETEVGKSVTLIVRRILTQSPTRGLRAQVIFNQSPLRVARDTLRAAVTGTFNEWHGGTYAPYVLCQDSRGQAMLRYL